MVYHGDPSLPQPHAIAPATLTELAADMTERPSAEAVETVRRLARRYPQWDPSRISARIRADTNRHDVTIAQIAWVLLDLRGIRVADEDKGAPSGTVEAPFE